MNNVFKSIANKSLISFLVMLCFLAFSPLKNSTAEISVPIEIQETSEDQLLMAFRRDRSQRLLHGKGRRGSGICPQARSTPPAPDKFLEMKNPLEINRAIVAKGKALFQYEAQPTACKVCHGSLGNGLGIMLGLNPMPRNFTCKQTMGEIPDGQMFYIITHGSQGTAMPAFRSLSDEQVWQLIAYLRSLSKDKSRLRRRR